MVCWGENMRLDDTARDIVLQDTFRCIFAMFKTFNSYRYHAGHGADVAPFLVEVFKRSKCR